MLGRGGDFSLTDLDKTQTEIHMNPTKNGVDPRAKPPEGGTTTILDNVEISSVGGSDMSESTEDICYEKGTTILNTYRVESDAIESGGMGRVWRVHHTLWNVDLAMKRPRAEYFSGVAAYRYRGEMARTNDSGAASSARWGAFLCNCHILRG